MPTRWTELIKQYRFQHGLTQHDVGCLLGVSQKTVSRWENGENRPSIVQQKQFRDLLREPSSRMADALRAAVNYCPVPRTLCVHKDLILLALSPPAIAARPLIVSRIGSSLIPLACGVLADMLDDSELQRSIAKGELACLTAITQNVLREVEQSDVLTTKTTVSFFPVDGTILCDAITMPAPREAKLGYWTTPLDSIVSG